MEEARTAESVLTEILNSFKRQVRMAHVTQDPRQRVVQLIRLEGMRTMALAAGLTRGKRVSRVE